MLAAAASAQVHAAWYDYTVHFADFEGPAQFHDKGDVVRGNDDVPLPVHEDACGMHFKHGSNYAWLNSNGAPVAADILNADIEVYAPYPGCGGGPVEAFLAGGFMAKPAAAVSLRIYDSPQAYWVDDDGQSVYTGLGGISDGPDGLKAPSRDEEYVLALDWLDAAKRQSVLPTRDEAVADAATGAVEAVRQALDESRGRSSSMFRDDVLERESAAVAAAASALRSANRFAAAGRAAEAYVMFDRAAESLASARAHSRSLAR